MGKITREEKLIEDQIILDIEILNIHKFIKIIDSDVKRLSNSLKDFNFDKIVELISIKQYLLRFYNKFKVIFFQLEDIERTVLYQYYFKNNSIYYIANILNCSVRTAFRKLNIIKNKYNTIRKMVMEGKFYGIYQI